MQDLIINIFLNQQYVFFNSPISNLSNFGELTNFILVPRNSYYLQQQRHLGWNKKKPLTLVLFFLKDKIIYLLNCFEKHGCCLPMIFLH